MAVRIDGTGNWGYFVKGAKSKMILPVVGIEKVQRNETYVSEKDMDRYLNEYRYRINRSTHRIVNVAGDNVFEFVPQVEDNLPSNAVVPKV